MSKLDWSTFTKRIFINKSVQEIYNAWADTAEITKWYFEKANYFLADGTARKGLIQKGDSYEWKWHSWDFIQKGKILEANGKDQLAFTFGEKAGDVKIEIKKLNDKRSQVILTQYNIATDDEGKMSYYSGCGQGWSFWMVNLKAWLEHGILLNETKNPEDFGRLVYEQVNS